MLNESRFRDPSRLRDPFQPFLFFLEVENGRLQNDPPLLENRGIDPRTSRMQSERSTVWASSPIAVYSIETPPILSLHLAAFQTSLWLFPVLLWHDQNRPQQSLENRGIDPRTSRMLSERSTIWASSPTHGVCFRTPIHRQRWVEATFRDPFRRPSFAKRKTSRQNDVHRPGIEPGPPAWQASILPLNHRCWTKADSAIRHVCATRFNHSSFS